MRSADRPQPATARLVVLLLAAFVLATALPLRAQMGPLEDLDRFPQGKLIIKGGKHPIEFEIWLADTQPRMAQGLMFVRSLAPQRGMLFVHESPRTLSMWMKNTYIPLDMIFIGSDRRVKHVAERTTPLSERTIASPVPVRYVLEVNAGVSDALGIAPGQALSGPALDEVR